MPPAAIFWRLNSPMPRTLPAGGAGGMQHITLNTSSSWQAAQGKAFEVPSACIQVATRRPQPPPRENNSSHHPAPNIY